MSPRLGAGPWSAHVMRTVIATAGVTTLVVARAGFAMAAGPLPGASVPTPAGTPSVSAATTPSGANVTGDRKSTRLNSSHLVISYAVFCLKKKKKRTDRQTWKQTYGEDAAEVYVD